jgi:hypothetical protein
MTDPVTGVITQENWFYYPELFYTEPVIYTESRTKKPAWSRIANPMDLVSAEGFPLMPAIEIPGQRVFSYPYATPFEEEEHLAPVHPPRLTTKFDFMEELLRTIVRETNLYAFSVRIKTGQNSGEPVFPYVLIHEHPEYHPFFMLNFDDKFVEWASERWLAPEGHKVVYDTLAFIINAINELKERRKDLMSRYDIYVRPRAYELWSKRHEKKTMNNPPAMYLGDESMLADTRRWIARYTPRRAR